MDGADGGRIVVLDGGLATELEARGHDLSDRLWSARLLLTDRTRSRPSTSPTSGPERQVATTASYQATVPGFAAAGLDRAAALGAIRDSVALARRARDRYRGGGRRVDRHGPPRRRVGRAVRRDAGRRLRVPRRLRPGRRPRSARSTRRGSRRCSRPASTCSRSRRSRPIREAEVLVGLLDEFEAHGLAELFVPRRIVDLGRRADRGGDRARRAIRGIVAVGVNCTAPRPAGPAGAPRDRPRTSPSSPTRTAATGGSRRPGAGSRTTTAAVRPGTSSRHGRTLGATWLGGCCGTGPAEIAALADRLERRPRHRL